MANSHPVASVPCDLEQSFIVLLTYLRLREITPLLGG
jgi:hypothetical protein